MDCYGRHYGQLDQCAECKFKRYCCNAGDPLPIVRYPLPEELNERVLSECGLPTGNRYERAEHDRRYTRADLLEVIVFMAALDYRTLDLISRRLKEPLLNFAEMAKQKAVSRQTVHKAIRQRIKRIPELASVLECRRKKNKGRVEHPEPIN